jgi:hypothetical protein
MVLVMTTEIMDAEWIDIDSVKLHPANPRVGYLPAIREAMQRNGWHGAIVVQKSTRLILAGNHRWLVAKELGLKRVLAHVVDVDDATARRILLADNRSADRATYDDPKLNEVLGMILTDEPQPDAALVGTGYTPDDATQLALALSGGEPQEWGSLGTPGHAEEVYAQSAIRQIVIIMSAEEYERVIPVVQRVMSEQRLDTVSAAFLWLLERFAPKGASESLADRATTGA